MAKTTAPVSSAKGSVNHPAKGSVKAAKSGSGTGSNLPEFQNLEWEPNRKGGWEAWHAPPGATKRKDKTYLGHVGKRLLAQWQNLHPVARRQAIEQWVHDKRAEKGVAQ